MVAHLDAVTSLAVDPNGIYLMSGSKETLGPPPVSASCPPPPSSLSPLLVHNHLASSSGHDCSLRLWNLDSKTCVQEITAHRKKSEEAIYDVAFHPSKAYIASAGADALARVYV